MRIRIIAALICWYPVLAQTAPAVRIRVVNRVTKAPIAGASVTVNGVRGTQARQLTGHTDANGVFTGNVEFAGSHLLAARHKGYRMISTGIMGTMIEIQAGQTNELTLEMLPLAVLAGRVLDQYGDPVRHAIVSTQAKMSGPGRGDRYESLLAATTDDLGEYRIADVEPGAYYLTVEYSARDERLYTPRSRYQWPEFGGLTFFPDASDLEHAQSVVARAGETTRLNDAHLRIQRAISLSGRVKPAQTDRAIVTVEPVEPKLSRHQSAGMSNGLETDGTFHVEVLPGIYNVRASDGSGKVSTILTIDAREKSVAGLELTLSQGQGHEISGRIVVDGTEHLDFSKVILHFMSEPAKIDSAGTFHANAGSSEVRYVIQQLPEDWYVKSFSVAGRSIAGTVFRLEAGQTEVVLTLSPKGAQVEVAAEGESDGNASLRAAAFALLPESGNVDVNSMLASQRGDPSGNFILHGVPPGDYRVFALDASNWAWLFRPDVLLEKYRNLAPLVTVAEGEHKKIVVPPTKIPVE